MASAQQPFTVQDAKLALTDILEAFRLPENVQRMREASENAANDMLKTMQVVFPVATHIQMGILPKYGFPADGDGLIRFAQTVKHLEKQDEDLAQLNGELRSLTIPQMAAPEPPTAVS